MTRYIGRPIYYSRKIWAAVIALAITTMLYSRGEIDGAQLAHAITWLAAVFIGATSVEDGLRNMVRIWTGQQPQPPIHVTVTQPQPQPEPKPSNYINGSAGSVGDTPPTTGPNRKFDNNGLNF